MKLKIVTPIILGLVAAVFCKDVSASDNEQKDTSDKRFSSDKGQFNSVSGQDSQFVDWDKAFRKRFSGSQSTSNTGDGNLVDWSKMFKRFGMQNGAQFGHNNDDNYIKWNSTFSKRFENNKNGLLDNDGKMIDWSSMYKRFGSPNGGQFGQNNNENFIKWNSAFAKRFQDNKNGFLDNDGKMVDWSSMYKRFGTEAGDPNLVDWSAQFQKNKRSKRSTSGFKRFRSGDMGFIPESLKSGDFIDWSRVFAKRGFGGYDGAFGNPLRTYTMQDWRKMMAKRNFGSQNMGYFGHDGLNDYGLQNWNSLVDRKRRSVTKNELEQ